MSSNNYGEKNLQIRIPIEIVPEEMGIKEEIAETKRRIKEGQSEEFRRQGIFDIYNRNDDQASPKGREAALPAESSNPLNILKRQTGKSGLVQGVPPTKPTYMKTSLAGTAKVPQGGQAPIDKKSFYAKTKETDDGLNEESVFARILGGPTKARQALNFLQNPASGVIEAINKIGGSGAGIAIGGGMALAQIALWVTKELVKKGGLFDRTFRNIIDDRAQVVFTRQQQQRYLVGFGDTAQLITTTVAGTTSPRDTFNTYTEKNKESQEHENRWAIRNDEGY
jgi:hypothetical protein